MTEQDQAEKIAQGVQGIELQEQIQLIHKVKAYFKEYIVPDAKLDPNWVSGYEMKSQINVAYSDEPVYKCTMEVFYQDEGALQRKRIYRVSLIRFANDPWLVFQVKENEMFN